MFDCPSWLLNNKSIVLKSKIDCLTPLLTYMILIIEEECSKLRPGVLSKLQKRNLFKLNKHPCILLCPFFSLIIGLWFETVVYIFTVIAGNLLMLCWHLPTQSLLSVDVRSICMLLMMTIVISNGIYAYLLLVGKWHQRVSYNIR